MLFLFVYFRFNTVGLIRMISMIHAIEEINNSTLLNGIKLGYDIYDTCTDVTTAVQATMELITSSSESCVEPHCKNTDFVPKVKAVVGCEYSEISIAVARVLNIQLIPQVSFKPVDLQCHFGVSNVMSKELTLMGSFKTDTELTEMKSKIDTNKINTIHWLRLLCNSNLFQAVL